MSEHGARAGKQRENAVYAVGIGDVLLIVPDAIEMVLRGEVVVEVRREEFTVILGRRLESEILAVVIVGGSDAVLQGSGGGRGELQVAIQDVEHHWIGSGRVGTDRRGEGRILGPGEIEQIHLAKLAGRGVLIS